MAQSWKVTGTPAVFVTVGDYDEMTVQNLGPSTVYYDETSLVSSSTNDGSIASGASATVGVGLFFAAATSGEAQALLVVSPVLSESAQSGSGLPDGGGAGDLLVKQSGTNGDADWETPTPATAVPDGGTTGQVLAKASNTDGDVDWADAASGGGSPFALPMAPTYYYKPYETDGSNFTVTDDHAFAIPFIVARSCLLHHAKVHLAVVAGAGAVARMGVYSDDEGIPDTLIDEFDATVSVTSGTGLKTFDSAAGIALTANTLYWLAFAEQGGASPGQYRQTSPYSGNILCPVDPDNLATGRGWHASIGFSGAFPSTATWSIAGQSVCAIIASDA